MDFVRSLPFELHATDSFTSLRSRQLNSVPRIPLNVKTTVLKGDMFKYFSKSFSVFVASCYIYIYIYISLKLIVNT
jgi:hypothetical protein